MNIVNPKAILMMLDYPEMEMSVDISGYIKSYGFALVLAIIIGHTSIGKKLHSFLMNTLGIRISSRKWLRILEYIPFLLSLVVLFVFKMIQYHAWSDIVAVISYFIMICLFLFSFRWATAIHEILKNRTNTPKDK